MPHRVNATTRFAMDQQYLHTVPHFVHKVQRKPELAGPTLDQSFFKSANITFIGIASVLTTVSRTWLSQNRSREYRISQSANVRLAHSFGDSLRRQPQSTDSIVRGRKLRLRFHNVHSTQNGSLMLHRRIPIAVQSSD